MTPAPHPAETRERAHERRRAAAVKLRPIRRLQLATDPKLTLLGARPRWLRDERGEQGEARDG